VVRDDLHVLVMSATLDGEAVSALIGDAPVITAHGRAYPVETQYIAPRAGGGAQIEAAVAGVIADALRDGAFGDVLAFLPGAREIHRVASLLAGRDLGDTLVTPLYGAMPNDAQDRAIRPDPTGRRKVVLATSIAETSLTIEGVRIVVDSGLARV